MRGVMIATLLVASLSIAAARAQAQACPGDPLAPARTPRVQLDAGPRPDGSASAYGTLQYHRPQGLGPKDVALTFDDGPDPRVTPKVLSILAQHCLKVTFFLVGWYAQARPDLVRQEADAGHFIGVHTWSHPDNLRRLSQTGAQVQIARGFEAVEGALAPGTVGERAQMTAFFRFPGLNDSAELRRWLGPRRVAVVGADFGADDWKGIGPAEIQRRALREAASSGGGILILHDTKPHTAEALSELITAFEQHGYRFVQLAPAPLGRDPSGASISLHGPLTPGADARPLTLVSVAEELEDQLRTARDTLRETSLDVKDWVHQVWRDLTAGSGLNPPKAVRRPVPPSVRRPAST